MKFSLRFLVVAGLLALLSCSKNETPSGPALPLLKITARDAQSQPVHGLRVSIWYHVDAPWWQTPKAAVAPMFATTLSYETPVACSVSLRVYSLASELVGYLVDRTENVGNHQVSWSLGQGAEGLPDGVYKCIMKTFDLSGNALFNDSILAVLLNPSAPRSVFGFTGSDGVFQTNEVLRFPNLLPLPALQGRDANNIAMGTFAYTDTVTIVLTDTLLNVSHEFIRTIKGSSNQIDLTWSPNPPARAEDLPDHISPGRIGRSDDANSALLHLADTRLKPLLDSTEVIDSANSPIPTEFRLHQNFPNPFN